MAGPVILAVDGDSQIPWTDSGETALDTAGRLELHGAPLTLDARPDETQFVVARR